MARSIDERGNEQPLTQKSNQDSLVMIFIEQPRGIKRKDEVVLTEKALK
ncbi:hypothetical protein [Paenibacillus sedimenti]|uniref:Uncharacterized protein n=1 Tax=Paenibacillus sedimenti TaxID=2770274 RepID=A0A926QKP3_9BACL|nr:hypothetical protein [Paenibacillus sedimenti]MBD0382810.1 hypothetical protein [Paenibacillus sedimenti]